MYLSHVFPVKVITLGDSSVGKTSLVRRFVDGFFMDSREISTGVDVRTKTRDLRGLEIQFIIHDTPGQERFMSVTNQYYRDADVVLFMYDSVNQESFDRIDFWIGQVKKYCHFDPVKILVGTKSDLKDQNQIPYESGRMKAAIHKMSFIEVSSLTGDNVDALFDLISGVITENSLKVKKIVDTHGQIRLRLQEVPQQSSSVKCCRR